MRKPFKSLKTSRVYKAKEIEYYRKLKLFSYKIDTSLKYWLLLAAKRKLTAKQTNKEINRLMSYWNKKATKLAESLPKTTANSIEKFVNLKLKAQSKEFSLKETTKLVRNEMNAIIERNAALIKTIPSEIVERYRSEVLNNIANLNQEALIHTFKSFEGISERRARTIARDQVQKAINDLQNAKAQQLGFNYYIWHTAQDSRVSDEHKRLEGRIYSFANPTAIIDSYNNVGHPANRVNCLPRGQGIDFTNIPLKLFRSVNPFNESTIYSISAMGQSFSVTSDHKVLTNRGWVSADSLNKGDYILKAIQKNGLINHINFNQDSIILSNLFDFIAEFTSILGVFGYSLTSFRAGSAGDFYKDIRANEQVYIIDMESLLSDCRNIILSQSFIQSQFPSTQIRIGFQSIISSFFPADCSADFLVQTISAPFESLIGIFSDLLSIINGGILKPNDIRLTSVSDFVIHTLEPFDNSASATLKQISDFKNAISQNVIILNLLCIYILIIVWKLINRYIVDNSTIPLEYRKTEKVRIENIERFKMDTHIYSLECDKGYYTIKGIINKNCRCFSEPILLEPNQELVLKKDSKSGDYYEIRNKE